MNPLPVPAIGLILMASIPSAWLQASNSSIKFPVYFEPDGVYSIVRGLKTGARLGQSGALRLSLPRARSFSLRFAGGNRRSRAEFSDPLPGRTHYFLGRDARQWRTNVPHYGRVRYRDVYPGIDVLYYGKPGSLEYDVVIAPGADPRCVRLAVTGASAVRTEGGDLLIEAGGRTLRHTRPRIYQETADGRVEIASRYAVEKNGQVRIEVDRYDRRRALVVDPTVVYSTLLGGDDEDDIRGLAVDAQGNAYVTGAAGSNNFPGSPSPNTKGRTRLFPDAYITKINAAGTAVLFTAFFGSPSGNDVGVGTALDSAGNIYLAGSTTSADFPVTSNAVQTKLGGMDAFLVKVDPSGSRLLYSTLLGGSNPEYPQALAVTPAGQAVVAGYTSSADFPRVSPLTSPAGGVLDAFVFRLDTATGRLIHSSAFGGSKEDQAYGVALDPAGNAYVTGSTMSPNFPVSPTAFQGTFKGYENAFVVKLNPAGNALVYSTFLGGGSSGSTTNVGNAIAVDAAGNAYVAGTTDSDDFPATALLMPKRAGVSTDVFLSKLNQNGSALVYSSLLGGGGFDYGFGVALTPSGEAWITGVVQDTGVSAFPTVHPTQRAWGGGFSDWFLCRVNSAGTALVFSTFLGGMGNEGGLSSPRRGGVAIDQTGAVYVAGQTTSADFPTTPGVSQPRYGGHATALSNAGEGFLVKIDPSREPAPVVITAQDRVITTIAGGGSLGGATSGPATQAAIGRISAMALHPSGAVIFASYACGPGDVIDGNVIPGNCASGPIRSVGRDGFIRVVAGAKSGSLGSGDGRPALEAALDISRGLAVDSEGNIYIAESDSSFGNRIWKVGTDGIIHRIAGTGKYGHDGDGGPGRDAQLAAPQGLTVDKLGNLYIAEIDRVRKLAPDGTITTIAGGGTAGIPAADGGRATLAKLEYPSAVAVDDAGNLFIAESYYIRKVTPEGVITTVAGANTFGIPNYNGDARQASTAAVYVPKSLTIASNGDLYIADTGNNRVRRIDRSGMIWNVAGTLGAGSSGDYGPGELAQLDGPLGIAFDSEGDLYIAEARRIRKLAAPRTLPQFDVSGVVNAAGNRPGAVIARGSIFTIYGAAMGPAAGMATPGYPLGAWLSDVTIRVQLGETIRSALPLYVSAGQINAIMPSDAPLGEVQVQVLYSGFPSKPVTVNVVPVSFQFFVAGNQNAGVFQCAVSPTNLPLCTPALLAHPGQIVIGWGTGLGAGPDPDNLPPQAASLPVDIEVLVGGKLAQVIYKGRAPTFAGVDNVYFVIPNDAPMGCSVPVQVRAGGVVSAPVTIAISAVGRIGEAGDTQPVIVCVE